MKPIYKSVAMTNVLLAIGLELSAELNNAGDITSQKVQADSLQGLSVKLVSPNVSGAKDLIASGDCVLKNEYINVNLSGLEQGTHRLTVSAEYGTQTVVLYALDIVVPAKLAEGEQKFEDKIIAVSTYADGDISGADATVYAKDGDGNAHITKPLSIGGGVATGEGAIASGNAYGEGASIQATDAGAIASGNADGEGASIQATDAGAIASGYAGEEGASIQATSAGAIASGYAYAGASIQATGDGAIASGHAAAGASIQATDAGAIASGRAAAGASIQATVAGAIASGNADETHGNVSASGQASQAFGFGTQTQTNAQMVLGKCNVLDINGDYALIVGNGASDQSRSNAFAIDWQGNLVLFNAGTPVVLTPAKLAQLIA